MEQAIAVIGAGLSGLVCAQQLVRQGKRVRVFDKGRGVAGRLSLRRVPPGDDRSLTGRWQGAPLQFDHGAQYFTARSDEFSRQTSAWQDQGLVEVWEGEFPTLDRGELGPDPGSGSPRYVGVPGMNELCKDMAEDLEVTCGVRVTQLQRESQGWRLQVDNLQTEEPEQVEETFAAVVCTIPAPQAVELLPAEVAFREKLESVRLAPCRCALLAFAEAVPVSFSGAFVQNSPLRWLAREQSKPGRPQEYDAWVLHASPEWSLNTVQESNENLAAPLLEAFAEALGLPLPTPVYYAMHRWLYAIPEVHLEQGCLVDPLQKLIAAGDWASGARVEGAYLSGLSAARAVDRLLS